MFCSQCSHCGEKVDRESAFCPNCGEKIKDVKPIYHAKKKGLLQAVIIGALVSILIGAVVGGIFFSLRRRLQRRL